ncbi:MAG: DUF805 domain-containing protein [Chloroflexota bacterium]
MNWYLKVLKQYFDFKGRARRKEYWMFTLFNLIILAALSVIDFAVLGADVETGGMILYPLYALIVFIPSLAVGIRRLHDSGRSGWYMFTVFIPVIGSLVLIYFLVQDSEAGDNKWGPNPKKAPQILANQMA